MSTSQKQKYNVPDLRFPEFSGEWEETKLGELAPNPSYGMNAPAVPFDGTHKYIRITDIDDDTRVFAPNPLTSPQKPIAKKYKLQNGDIVFTRTGASTGKTYLYNPKDGDLFFAGFLIRFRVKSDCPAFIFYHTLRQEYQKWLTVMSMRSGQPGVNANEYSQLIIHIPHRPEQEKIASFLSSVDLKIEQLGKKKALLEQYKKGMMRKLFSQELRFKDTQGNDFPDWEEKRLGDLGDFQGGGTPDTKVKEFWAGNIPWVSSSDISEDSVQRINLRRNITEKATKKSATKIIPPNSLLIVSRVGVGKLAVSTAALCTSQDFCNFTPFQDCVLFLAYWMSKNRRKLLSLCQGTSIKGLTTKELQALKIHLPWVDEQEKIASFLSAIDQKIDLVTTELTQTHSFKKGLLQKMFI